MRCYSQYNDTNNLYNSYTVSQLAKIYEFPSYKKTSSVIGILSFGGGIYGNINNNILTNGDVQKYWELQGIEMSTVYIYFYNGATNDLNDSKSTLENTIDVSVIGSCCQSIIILFIFPNDTPLVYAFTIILEGIIINDNKIIPNIISVSWGTPEHLKNTYDIIKINNLLKNNLLNQNTNICVASGDKGSTNDTNELIVDFPASSPYVTAVGGTSLICPNLIYESNTSETVWNNGTGATGGGISKICIKPSYQKNINGMYRNIPDIAFNSDPLTGIDLIINGILKKGVGGTSIAAPFFAGFIALSNINTFINPLLYSCPMNCYHDITIGTNEINEIKINKKNKYIADIGYDNCTGNGSLIGSEFIKYINVSNINVSM